MDYPVNNYAALSAVNPNILFNGLGSFWTQLFQEKATLKGLTIAQAEELVQRYYNLIEVVNSYTVKDTNIFHKERWYPIYMYKSKFNQSKLQFLTDDAVFGAQPETDRFYANVTFQFGYPKIPSATVYSYQLEDKIADLSVICDKVLNPSIVYIKGTDVIIDKNVIFFNKDIFNDKQLIKLPVINDLGEQQVFTDLNGIEQNEEMLILWAYNTEIDTELLWNNFGILLGVYQDNNQFYKDILKAVLNLYVEGPSILALKTLSTALLNIPITLHPVEKIETVFSDSYYHYVVTDKEVYKFDIAYNLLPVVAVGNTIKAGDILVDAVAFYDAVNYPNWWNRGVISVPTSDNKSYLSLANNLFLGSYKFQLTFSYGIELVSIDEDNNLHFPVIGEAEDIAEFNRQIDTNQMRTALGLAGAGSVAVVNPVDFLMNNFFKNNMAMLKLKTSASKITKYFSEYIQILFETIPEHIYLICDLAISLSTEVYSELNNSTPITIEDGDVRILNMDGSDDEGLIESIAPLYYTSVKHRLFAIGMSPDIVYEQVLTDADPSDIVDGCVLKAGDSTLPLKEIPVGSTTANYSNLVLLNFS